jgi:hypothetical protein
MGAEPTSRARPGGSGSNRPAAGPRCRGGCTGAGDRDDAAPGADETVLATTLISTGPLVRERLRVWRA